MADQPFDVIIVGQGLAGTTLAWHLREAGQSVLLVDSCEAVTSSKIAAGLITPITGQRLTVSSQFDDFAAVAKAFYGRIEKCTGSKFFYDRLAVRLFKFDAERDSWSKRKTQNAFRAHLVVPEPAVLLEPDLGDSGGGGFVMKAAQLDVAAYLEVSSGVLPCVRMTVDWDRDVALGVDEVSVCGYRARRVVSCEGFGATRNPYFSMVPFRAAKGNILTVRFHRPIPRICVHRGIWIAPSDDSCIFRVGSTYDWDTLDQEPDAAAREEIERKLTAFFRVPYTVLDHKAAVRPIIDESKPVVGFHPEHERIGFFNGLGSKGSLLAPWFAQRLTELIVNQTPLPEAVDLRKMF